MYRYDGQSGLPLHGYNLLRHCGAIWALSQGALLSSRRLDIERAAHRAAGWLATQRIRQLADGTSAVVGNDQAIKLGGNALAIIAICRTSLVQMADWRALCTDLGSYIVGQYRGTGTFNSKVDSASMQVYAFASEYYTGQALLALVELWQLTGEGRWLDVCEDAMSHLARRQYGVVTQNHWMMYAVEALYRARPSAALATYAAQLAQHTIDNPAYRRLNRSTPIACRTEALLAFYRLASLDGAPVPVATIAAAMTAIRENLALQHRCLLPDGAFVRGGGSAEVRIDYVQHNLLTFLGFSALRLAPR